jgi:hypothetical protein
MTQFLRRIVIVVQPDGQKQRARAVLEDDFHHFRVELTCQDQHILKVDGSAPRHPYSLCPGALEPLKALEGMPLVRKAHAVTRQTDANQQCTHMLELAGLAMAAVARGDQRRQYDIEVPMRVDGRTQTRLWRDAELLLTWEVEGTTIVGPEPFTGVDLYQGLARWALQTLPEELAEAALALRRGTVISIGRMKNLDLEIHARPSGRCYAQQPVRAESALRQIGSTLDFSTRAEQLCADDQVWLAGQEASSVP